MLLFKKRKKRKKDLKYVLLSAATSARMGITKIESLVQRLKARRDKLFNKIVEYKSKGYIDAAKFYSNEVVQIDKMIAELVKIQVALEQVAIRAETIAMTGVAVGYISSLRNVVRELKKSLGAVIPEVSMALSEVEEKLETVLIESKSTLNTSGSIQAVTNDEAMRILKEAEEIARIKLEESFRK